MSLNHFHHHQTKRARLADVLQEEQVNVGLNGNPAKITSDYVLGLRKTCCLRHNTCATSHWRQRTLTPWLQSVGYCPCTHRYDRGQKTKTHQRQGLPQKSAGTTDQSTRKPKGECTTKHSQWPARMSLPPPTCRRKTCRSCRQM